MMTAETVREASIAVAKAEQALAAAQAELKRAESGGGELSPEQTFAIALHETRCRWNHTDGCGWEYEIKNRTEHQWGDWTHAKYLEQAEPISALFPELDLMLPSEVLHAVEGL